LIQHVLILLDLVCYFEREKLHFFWTEWFSVTGSTICPIFTDPDLFERIYRGFT
jgi:hypothetical protein